MTSDRRQRVDSAPAIIAAIGAAGRTFALPSGIIMDDEEAAIFDEVMDEFPKVEMTEHRARICAMLAKALAIAARSQAAISREGSVITNRRGNRVLNPHVRVAAKAISTVLAYRRSLGITARALNGMDTRNVTIRRQHNLASQHLVDEIEDDLLARPFAPFNRRDH